MPLTKEDLDQIANVFETIWQKKHHEFWIEAEQHYLDHQQLAECRVSKSEWIKNHEFVSEFRAATDQVKKVGLKTTIGLLAAAFTVWMAHVLGFDIAKWLHWK